MSLPKPPDHSFVKKVLKSKSHEANETSDTCNKKVFIKFVQGPYTFKKRREKANRVTFSCNGFEKLSHYLPVFAWRDRIDSDPENDQYTLDAESLPSYEDHLCGTTGIEDMMHLKKRLQMTLPNPFLHCTRQYGLGSLKS